MDNQKSDIRALMSTHLAGIVLVGGCSGLSCHMAPPSGARQSLVEAWGNLADLSPHTSVVSTSKPAMVAVPAWQPPKTTTQFNVTAKLGSEACQAYNKDRCAFTEKHPKNHHVCCYCLVMVNCLCAHQEELCLCKQYAAANNA